MMTLRSSHFSDFAERALCAASKPRDKGKAEAAKGGQSTMLSAASARLAVSSIMSNTLNKKHGHKTSAAVTLTVRSLRLLDHV